MNLDIVQEPPKPLLPLLGMGIPGPAGEVLESTFTIRVQDVLSSPLIADPLTELEILHHEIARNGGVTVVPGVVRESTESLLPCLCPRTPDPTAQFLQAAFAVSFKGSFCIPAALCIHPQAQRIAVDYIGLRDAGITVVIDIGSEPPEPFLPPVRYRVPRPTGQRL